MKYRQFPALLFLAVVSAATPAFANPSAAAGDLALLVSVLILLAVYFALSRCSGVDSVLSELYTAKERPNQTVGAIILIVFSLSAPFFGFLALAVWCFATGGAMVLWATSAALRRERPAHLREVRVARMLLCGVLLLIAIPATGFLSPHMLRPLFLGHAQPAHMKATTRDIESLNTAFSKILADAHAKDLHELFANPAELDRPTITETIENQTKVCWELLTKGKNAGLDLKAETRQALAACYVLRMNTDQWGTAYQFYLGPLRCRVNEVPFRCYRGKKYVYDRAAFDEAEKQMRKNPEPDADIPPAPGYPAPRDLPFYIFSYGQNKKPEQLPWNGNGGDDINNWDNESRWGEFYN